MNVQDIWREAEKKRIEYRKKGETQLLNEMMDEYLGLKSLVMSLLDEIRTAQRDAGEAAVIASLQRQGLLPAEPPPMFPQGIINKLEGEAKVLRILLGKCVDVIDTIPGESDDECRRLLRLKDACIQAMTVVL